MCSVEHIPGPPQFSKFKVFFLMILHFTSPLSERTGRVTTRLRPLTRVKHCRAGLVLGQVTDRDVCPWARHVH